MASIPTPRREGFSPKRASTRSIMFRAAPTSAWGTDGDPRPPRPGGCATRASRRSRAKPRRLPARHDTSVPAWTAQSHRQPPGAFCLAGAMGGGDNPGDRKGRGHAGKRSLCPQKLVNSNSSHFCGAPADILVCCAASTSTAACRRLHGDSAQEMVGIEEIESTACAVPQPSARRSATKTRNNRRLCLLGRNRLLAYVRVSTNDTSRAVPTFRMEERRAVQSPAASSSARRRRLSR